jgi:alkylhydroperoxidase family enzyme
LLHKAVELAASDALTIASSGRKECIRLPRESSNGANWRLKLKRAFQAFSQRVFADGALPGKVKQLIAVAVAHVTQCPYCIKGG